MTKPAQQIKRAVDIFAVLAVSPLVLAVTMVIAIVIRLTSGSPAIFCQTRAGRDFKPFTFYKFRTMRTDVDPFGPSPRSGQDPRLTRIGRWLRLTSLDELPQLWNVLKGDMSLIGPRPLYMAQAAEWNQRQLKRLMVQPGMTGLAQISGRGSLTIEEKLELDVKYVEQQSLWLDARIFLTTVFGLFVPKDIYEKKFSHTRDTWSVKNDE
jgi:lipopolysaccharide/colanic/teichoic acid biosynthesis glycosyltransferase